MESARADLVWLLLRFQSPECSSKSKDVGVSDVHSVHSTVGEGTAFTVVLPVAR